MGKHNICESSAEAPNRAEAAYEEMAVIRKALEKHPVNSLGWTWVLVALRVGS